MRIILVRHGQSFGNKNNFIQGHKDYKLTEKGILQSRKTAQKLKDVKFAAIFCSDLSRAKQTAKIIAKFHKGTPFFPTKLLRERKLGEWEGLKSSKIDFEKVRMKRPKGGETFPEIRKRAKIFLEMASKKYAEEDTILVVAHAGSIRMLWSVLLKMPIKECVETLKFKSTSISEIKVLKNKQSKVIKENYRTHLK